MTTPAERNFNKSPSGVWKDPVLKQAYRLVVADLYQQFLKMAPNQTLRLTKLGKFTKRTVQAKSGLDGNTYVYYRINFSPFRSLKDTLNQSLTE